MGIVIVLVVVAIVFYFAIYRPKKERQRQWNERVKSLSGSDFVVEGMQTLAVMLALRESEELGEKKGCKGLFCVAQENHLLLQLNVRADSVVFLVKRLDDGVRSADGQIITSYGELLAQRLDSILGKAQQKESRLNGIYQFEDLHIDCAVDPNDEYDEWVIFEKQIPIPSRAYVAALKLEIEKKYPGYIGRQIGFID